MYQELSVICQQLSKCLYALPYFLHSTAIYTGMAKGCPPKDFLAFFLIDCNWHCCLCFTLVTCLMPVFHVPQSLNICSIFDIGDVLVVLVLIIPFTWTVFLIAYEKEIFQDS